jgi:hypothetical protein
VNRLGLGRVARQIACTAIRLMYSRGEYYRPEHYRRLGLAAQQRAAQSTDSRIKEAFKDVARHWLMLVERVEWLETQYNSQQAEKNR